jgi:MarR family transcriptional repressor of emrRAB
MANLLGAAALAVTDAMLARVAKTADTSASAAAALVVLADSPAGLSATELARRIGLTQSATVRMVLSLASKGFVDRRSGPGREIPVVLTGAGRAAAERLLAAREDVLQEFTGVLTPEERHTLESLMAKLLAHRYSDVRNAEFMCRLCDRGGCTMQATCPVGQAERNVRE